MSLLTNRKKSSAPCPDCKLSMTEDGMYKYGSETTGYKTSSDRETAKKKHQQAYPDSYKPKMEMPNDVKQSYKAAMDTSSTPMKMPTLKK
jgi:hypothetical protein